MTKWNCPTEQDLFAYLNHRLPEKKSAEIENHIDSCTDCRLVVVEWAKDQKPDSQIEELWLTHQGQPILCQGTRIGRFVVLEKVGAGGMGEVYAAYDEQLDRKVALKVLHTEVSNENNSSESQRLLREARSLAKLSHPNVVAVHEVGSHLDQLYMAMEFVEGQNLGQLFTKNSRSWKENLEILVEAGRGLAAAHAAGIIHRDFKPENVMIDKQGWVRVADFGLAKVVDSNVSVEKIFDRNVSLRQINTIRTASGAIGGSPAYMSPEQFAGNKVDARSDQFSFCVVLYIGLYGESPFCGSTLEERKASVENGQIVPAPKDTDVPLWLREVVVRGLQPKPEDRYTSMEELLGKLTDDPEKKAQRRRRRAKRITTMAVLALVAISAPLAVWYEYFVRRSQLCKGAKEKIAAVWNQEIKKDIEKALLDTGVSYAKDTAERVNKLVEAYTKEWEDHYTKACEATHLKGEQSDEILDLRMGCLRKRSEDLKALLNLFRKADAGIVQKSVQAIASLSKIESCADENALRSPYPPPKTEEAEAKVESIRERLVEVEAFHKTGKYQEGLDLANKLLEETKAFDYKPVRAEVSFWIGKLLDELGEYKKAESELNNALQYAGEIGYEYFSAKSAALLVSVVGYRQARYEDGLLIGRYAEALLGPVVGANVIRTRLLLDIGIILLTMRNLEAAREYIQKALLLAEKTVGREHIAFADALNNLGNVDINEGKYEQALECYRNAVIIKEKVLGPEHPSVASSLNNLGVLYEDQGKYDNALVYYRRALEIWEKALGPDHPDVARILNNIGIIFRSKGLFDVALEYLHRSVAVFQKALGPDHPYVAMALSHTGIALVARGSPQKALEHLEKFTAICDKNFCEPSFHGKGLLSFSRALVATGGEKQRAIWLAKQAREVYFKNPKNFRNEIEEVDAWLKKRGVSKSKSTAAVEDQL